MYGGVCIHGVAFRVHPRRTHFGVAPPAAAAWLLQQRLDEAAAPGPGGAAALHRAAELLPAVEGAALPRQAMEVGGG